MITFSIEDATIALLYLLILISSVIMIALVYLIVLIRDNNEKILQLTSKYVCDSIANGTSTYRSYVSGEDVLDSLKRYRNEYEKGFGGIVYPQDVKITGEQLKEYLDRLKKEFNIKNDRQVNKGFAKSGIVKSNDLANV